MEELGGLAGADCILLAEVPYRKVDVTGINEHQVFGLRIGTVG